MFSLIARGLFFFVLTILLYHELSVLFRMLVSSLYKPCLLQLTYYVQKLFITMPVLYESRTKNHSKGVGSTMEKVTNGDSSDCGKGCNI